MAKSILFNVLHRCSKQVAMDSHFGMKLTKAGFSRRSSLLADFPDPAFEAVFGRQCTLRFVPLIDVQLTGNRKETIPQRLYLQETNSQRKGSENRKGKHRANRGNGETPQ